MLKQSILSRKYLQKLGQKTQSPHYISYSFENW